MKNLNFIFVFLVLAGLTSCSSDDDGSKGPAEVDRIVGEWKIQSLSINGEGLELSDCELQTRVRFSADGNIIATNRFENGLEECLSEVSAEKWEYRGNNVYRITDEDGPRDVTFIFSNSNNTFTVSEEDEDGSYSTTYVRV